MEKKQIIQQQYFDLSRVLNQTNEVKYTNKEMYFYTKYIDDEELLFACISDWQKISICKKKTSNHWLPTRHTPYENLEEAIAKWTPSCLQQPDLTKCIKNHIFVT